jgi:hypothetical protein
MCMRRPGTHTQVCLSTVGTLGDVCRACGQAVLPFCDELLSIILQVSQPVKRQSC